MADAGDADRRVAARAVARECRAVNGVLRGIEQRLRSEGRTDAPARVSIVGVQLASYLLGAFARHPDDGPRARLALAVLDLWASLPSEPPEDPRVLSRAFATLVASTTHDIAHRESPRFDRRARVALGLAPGSDGSDEGWVALWESAAAVGEATRFDLGTVAGNARFWASLDALLADVPSSEWLAGSGGPADERILRAALDAVRPSVGGAGLAADEVVALSPGPAARVPARALSASEAPRRRVYFATNRERRDGKDGRPEFTAESSAQTRFGWCDVEAPAPVPGRVPTPADLFALAEIHVVDDEAALVPDLRARAAEAPRILVFVHGYNSRFDQAAVRAAQLALDVLPGSDAAFFSWPSAGNWVLYGRDAGKVDLAAAPLARFLRMLAVDARYSRIDVIVHSLGNRAFAQTVDLLAAAREGIPLGSVFLAAADIDHDRFDQVAPRIVAMAAVPPTVYVSARDRALLWSKLTFNQEPRVGRDLPIPRAVGAHTLDATRVHSPDFFRHEYFAMTASVVEDIRAQLAGAIDPDARGDTLTRMPEVDGVPSWRFATGA